MTATLRPEPDEYTKDILNRMGNAERRVRREKLKTVQANTIFSEE